MKSKPKLWRFVPLLALAVALMAITTSSALAAVWTDRTDYTPGSVVTISGDNSDGSHYLAGETVQVDVQGPLAYLYGCSATVGVTGAWSCQFTLSSDPTYAVGTYSYMATGLTSFETQTGTFTDAAPPSNQNLWQCDPLDLASRATTDCTTSAATGWVTGNNDGPFLEGDTVPYRTRFQNLVVGNKYRLEIEWDTTKSGKHAIDYLKTVNATVTNANPCASLSPAVTCGTPVVFPIPPDAFMQSDPGFNGVQDPGNFWIYNGNIDSTSSYINPPNYVGDTSTSINVYFTASNADVVIAWGGHIADRRTWGQNNSAVSISGSPYHMRLHSFYDVTNDTTLNIGNTDRSLSAEAVIYPGSIKIIKDATPNGSTSFGFTASPAPLADFSLVDDGTSANTKLFSNITTFQTYVINESSIPTNWGFDSVSCEVTSLNGGSYTKSTTTVDISMKEGENWTCTYLDSIRVGTLTVIKHVVNDNGGTATASQWSLHVKSGSSEVSGSPAAGSESGTSYTLAGGIYNVSESGGPSGYTFLGFSGDCDSTGNVTVAAGATKTCTLTNDDQQAYVIVTKVVINTHGGSAKADDFKLTLDGNATTSGTKIAVNPGSYTAGETQLAGYTFDGYSGDCNSSGSVTVALGETKTCTLTNSDQQAYVIVKKVVINDNGGSAQPDDFKLTLDGNATTSGTKIAVNPGSHTAAETQVSGYTFTGFSGDCDSSGKVTVALGETKTCTLTNNDKPAHIIVNKVVINDNGGSAQPNDFKLTLDGSSMTSGADNTVNAGNHTAAETQLKGYSFVGFSGDCDSNGNVTVALGETKVCTLTNDDQQAYVIVNKVVINNNGGSANPDDFKLTLDGNTTTSGTKIPVNPGSHTAAETLLSGYMFSGFTGDCNSSGSVTVALGETKTCTLTNDDQQAYVTVVKQVINDNGGSAKPDDFKLTLNGNATTSGTKIAVDPGTYTAGETQLSGYIFKGYSDDCDSSGKVTVALGESKTCTLTNDDQQAYVIVNKVVVNDNGGTAKADDFKLTLDGNATTSGTKIAVNPGGHTAAETLLYGYSGPAFSGDCDSTGKVSVALGETKTCTLTNDDQPGTIIIKKITKPVNTGSFGFTTTGTGYNGFTLPGGGQNSQSVNAGSYTVKEGMQLGWILTGIGGSTDPNTPYNCTVTGSGGSTGVGDLNTQTATINLKNGDTVTCVFENTGQGVTRTQGFWATHSQLANIAWFGGTAFGHTFPGVAGTAGIGDTSLCTRPIDTLEKLMGGFWSDISKTSVGVKRSQLDQARMQLLQQMLAAELNASAFGSVPSGGSGMFANWEAAYCGTNIKDIQNATQQAAAFNSAGDSSTFTPGTSADSKHARAIAAYKFWDILP